jgi:hypothetical protein
MNDLISLLIAALKHRTPGLNAVISWVFSVWGNIVAGAILLWYMDTPLKRLKRRMRRPRPRIVQISGHSTSRTTATGNLTVKPQDPPEPPPSIPPPGVPPSPPPSPWIQFEAYRRLQDLQARAAMDSTLKGFNPALLSPTSNAHPGSAVITPPSGAIFLNNSAAAAVHDAALHARNMSGSWSTYGTFQPGFQPGAFQPGSDPTRFH